MTELKEIKSRPFAFLKISGKHTLHTFAYSHEPTLKSPQAKECNFADTLRIPLFLSIFVNHLFLTI